MQLILRLMREDLPAPVLRFVPGRYIFGRDNNCHVCLRERAVSRRHFELIVGRNEASACDLGSRNHTFLNNRRLETAQALGDGDRLSACSARLRIEMLSDKADTSPEWITVPSDGPGVIIDLLPESDNTSRRREAERVHIDGRLDTTGKANSGPLRKLVSGVYEIPLSIPGHDLAITFDLLQPLGRGQFGEVWWAKSRGTCPDWHEGALKITHEAEGNGGALRIWRAAGSVMGIPPHPHLLRVRFIGSFLGRLAVETEVADGSLADLADALPRADCKPRLIAAVRESAAALDHLHRHGLVHGCPKPTDILLFRGRAKVGDLDLVHNPRDASDAESAAQCGSPGYLAPEVWDGRTSPRSDQYALACGYAELRGGRRVFPAFQRAEWERCHRIETPDLSRLAPAEQWAVRRALAKDPEARYDSCSEFAAAIAAAS